MIPARFLTIPDCSCLGDQASEWLSTIRLLQFGGLLDCRCRALVIVSYPILFLPPAVSPSHRLPRLAYVIPLWHPLCYSACTSCTRRISTSFLSVSPVPRHLLRPASVVAPPNSTSARRTRRDCDRTSPLPPQLLGEPDRISRLLRSYQTGTK